MTALPPGTILQLMYLEERLSKLAPRSFIEIGPGSGEISSLLLRLGWEGCSYDLEERTVARLNARFSVEMAQNRYKAVTQDFFAIKDNPECKVDLIISCMVIEHFDKELESKFMRKASQLLHEDGAMIGLVPGSPNHWGIEDDIAGHCRRYTRNDLYALAKNQEWRLNHVAGLTYPISNILLPISNFLVRKAEKSKMSLSNLDKTKASGIRNVKFKTHFPPFLSLLLNRYTLLPLHWLQKFFSSSSGSLILYFEAIPNKKANSL